MRSPRHATAGEYAAPVEPANLRRAEAVGPSRARRYARLALGWTLLVAGAAMLFLPLPGLPVFLGGVALLERDVPWARKLRDLVQNTIFELPAIRIGSRRAVALVTIHEGRARRRA